MIETKNKQKHNGEITYTNGEKEIIEYGITAITKDTYRRKRDFAAIVLPNSVERIGEMAFYDCKKLERVYLPNSIEEIESDAFAGCNMLRNIDIPNSVHKLAGQAVLKKGELYERS